MNRRRFVTSSGAAAVALGSGLAPQKASAASPPALMKLGCQSAPTNETHLKYFARYGVRNICGYPQIADGRLYATVDELKRMRDLAEKNGISIDCLAPPFLASSHIDREKHGAIMLAQSPERDRDIEAMQTLIRNCAAAGIPSIKYNMSILGVLRTGRSPGRGDATYSTWRLKDAHPDPPLTRAGNVNADDVLGAHHLLPGARHPGGRGEQDPHGLPPARSRRAARRLPGRGSRAGHGGRPEEVHHHQGEPVSRAELLPGHGVGDARAIRARKSTT